jgi:hypothetical protein
VPENSIEFMHGKKIPFWEMHKWFLVYRTMVISRILFGIGIVYTVSKYAMAL